MAKNVKIELHKKDDYIVLEVDDDGIGFDIGNINYENTGFGLSNIKQRVKDLGGTLTIDSKEKKGTKINIIVRYKDI